MRIPENLSGPTKKFIVVGKYYVNPKDKRAVREMKKRLVLYGSTKEFILTKAFWLLSHFIGYDVLGTKASLIHKGEKTTFFDFENKEVHTVFHDKKLMNKNVKWIRKLTPRTQVPELLGQNPKDGTVITRYKEFEFLPLDKFRIYSNEVVEINSALWGKPKKMRTRDFVKSLQTPGMELTTQRLKELKGGKTVYVCGSHGKFHPGNLPRYGTRFYLLDFSHIGMRPKIFDFAYFSFVPAVFNKSFIKSGTKLFKKFLDLIDPSPIETVISLSMVGSRDTQLQKFFEENEFFVM